MVMPSNIESELWNIINLHFVKFAIT